MNSKTRLYLQHNMDKVLVIFFVFFSAYKGYEECADQCVLTTKKVTTKNYTVTVNHFN
jgi:hypothetical protein